MAKLFDKGIFLVLISTSVVLLVFHTLFLAVSIYSRRVVAGALGLEGLWARMLYLAMTASDVFVIMLLVTGLRRGGLNTRSALAAIFFSALSLNLPALLYTAYLIHSRREKQ